MWHTSRNGDPDQMAVVRLERYDQFILNIIFSILCINQFSDQFLILQRSTKEKKEENKNIEDGNSETAIVPAPTMMYPPSINQNSTSSTRYTAEQHSFFCSRLCVT
jgi:hypothetical protein